MSELSAAERTVVHKVIWETTVLEKRPKKWYHKILGYTPVDHHLRILEGAAHCVDSDSLDIMLNSFHERVKSALDNEYDELRYRRNVKDGLLRKP